MANMTAREEADRLKAEKKRRKAEEKKMSAQLGGDAGALAAHGLSTIVFTKVPRLQSFDKGGKVRTRAVAAVPLYIGGLAAGDDAMGIAIRGVGFLWAGIELERWISTQTWAQPAAAGG